MLMMMSDAGEVEVVREEDLLSRSWISRIHFMITGIANQRGLGSREHFLPLDRFPPIAGSPLSSRELAVTNVILAIKAIKMMSGARVLSPGPCRKAESLIEELLTPVGSPHYDLIMYI